MKKRSTLSVIMRLLGLLKSLLPVMFLSVLCGTVGAICAIYIPVKAVSMILDKQFSMMACAFLIGAAVLRSILHYIEQYCNHYLAFKQLSVIRHKVFVALSRLAPAKLEGKDRGQLITMITSDVERLEVFYAHTISPVLIALCVTIVLAVYLATIHPAAALILVIGHLIIGVIIPLLYGGQTQSEGAKIQSEFADLNNYVLESLKGALEIIQYKAGQKRRETMLKASERINEHKRDLSKLNASLTSLVSFMTMFMTLVMLIVLSLLFSRHFVNERGIILATVVMMSSCGPVNALANLAGGLSETIACGNRILTILDEPPLIRRVTKGADVRFGGMTVNHVSFGYTKDENVLNNCQMLIPAHKMVGIMGDSGSGKSTLMKLMMRFYDVNSGSIFMSDHDIRDINTHSLRMNEAYMTQDTHIFNDTIAANIAVGKKDALMGDIINAALAASLHDFVESLPDGYNTVVGEDGYKLSSGERQRIGLARAFLSDAPLMLLDEPTSALDALNEGMILRSLEKSRWQKTIVLISHRPSALSRADIVYEIKKI